MNWAKLFFPWGIFFLALFWLPGSWMPFQSGKWLGIALLAAISFCFWAFRREIAVPSFRKWELFTFLALVIGILSSMFWFHRWHMELSLLDRWSFFLLVYFAWHSFRSGLQWKDFFYPLIFSVVVVSVYGLYQLYEVGFPGEMPYTKVGSLFGHSNNAAQFIGMGILLLWVAAEGRHKPALVATILGLSYLYLSRGRSALLAFGLATLVALFFQRKKIPWKFVGIAGGVFFLVAVGIQLGKGFSFGDVLRAKIFQEKPSMVTYRADVWTQTLEMIKARPFGVGVDKFPFRFVPFHQRGTTVSTDHIALSPHNEFLRYPAEDGIFLAMFFLVVALYLFYRWVQSTPRELRQPFYPFLAFVFFEAFFQFPFQNPLPAYFTAIFVGWMLYRSWGEKVVSQKIPLGPVFVLIFLYVFTKVAVSRKFETTGSAGWAQVSCSWVPSNWQACLNYSRLLMNQGSLTEARTVIEGVLERDPANFTATRHLAVVAFRQGRLLEGCFHTWSYDYVFGGKSDVRANYEQNCPKKFRDYFDRKKPTRYYHRQ